MSKSPRYNKVRDCPTSGDRVKQPMDPTVGTVTGYMRHGRGFSVWVVWAEEGAAYYAMSELVAVELVPHPRAAASS